MTRAPCTQNNNELSIGILNEIYCIVFYFVLWKAWKFGMYREKFTFTEANSAHEYTIMVALNIHSEVTRRI